MTVRALRSNVRTGREKLPIGPTARVNRSAGSHVEGSRMRRLVFLLAVLATTRVSAQSRFAEAEVRATEVDAARFADDVAMLLADCTAATSAAAKRSCVTARRRAGRDALRATYLVELPAASMLRFGSYETANEGFRVYVNGFSFRRSDGPGVLATAPTLAGRLPRAHVARAGFVHVAAADAGLWLSTHSPDDYAIRAIVRLAEDFEDTAAPNANERYGVRLEVLGIQVYGVRSGEVLVDSYAVILPPALARLEERTRLWSHQEQQEALFVANDGTEVVLSARLDPREPGSTVDAASLVQTVGATRTDLLRTSAPCCTASIDVRRHGSTKLLAIVTEQVATTGVPGRGRVVLLEWSRASARFEQRAEWVGANDAAPPAWVLDPNAEP